MPIDLQSAMRAARQVDPGSVPDVLSSLAAEIGATDLVVYLVDFEQKTLLPVPDRGTHSVVPKPEEIANSMAGRAFAERRVVAMPSDEATRLWAPLLEGPDRTGVLAFTVQDQSETVLRDCEDLSLLAGYLIATLARSTDLYNLYRRRRSMTLAASIQWDLLPPLTLTSHSLNAAGMLEPAYDVGGDSFDYALNDNFFEMAIVDAAGRGITAAMISVLAVGSYRHDRREGQGLDRIHANLDEVLATHQPPSAFATGQLARVDLATGEMSWTNAGHPLPLLVRGDEVERELQCRPTPPWGFGHLKADAAVPISREQLVPGDQVLFYTDGVVESRDANGEFFGLDRLARLVTEHSAVGARPEETARRVIRAILDHTGDPLPDDATLVLWEWDGPSA
jgi:serine phosphatase RsbU (regulator of sigma subunit)